MSRTTQKRIGMVALAGLLALLALTVGARPGSAGVEQAIAPRAVPGELLVRFEAGTDVAERAAARRRAGVRLERKLLLPGLELVRTGAEVSVPDAIAALERQRPVRYAEPNWIATPQAATNDPRFGEQWPLDNTGQGGGTPGADISAPEAWDVTTGSSDVVVAVIDTGIAYDHADLAGNMWQNPGEAGEEANGVDDDHNGFVDDRRGWDFLDDDPDPYEPNAHATATAGVIGAEGDNQRGGAGVSWDVRLMPLKVGTSSDITTAAVTDAIVYAGRMGADVANMSLGGGFSQAMKDAIDSAPETLFVAAAGNAAGIDNDVNPTYPCSYSSANLICVAATDRNDALWDGSKFGATTVDLGAPGAVVPMASPDFEVLFSDDFEGPMAKWDYDELADPVDPGRWRRTQEKQRVGSLRVLSDSEGGSYPNGANTTVTLQTPVDLSGESGCRAHYLVQMRTESGRDHLRVEAAATLAGPYTELERRSGDTAGEWRQGTASLAEFEGGDVYLRFRLTSDAANALDGAYLDDVKVGCGDPLDSYDFGTGTSLAAPHVAGAAALVKAAYPDASVAELRARILGSVDPLPSLAGKTVTGGRLNVYAALTETPDTTAPDLAIDAAPPASTSSRSASFAFSSSDPVARFECRLDGGAFAACVSPKQYTDLAGGEHSFAVRATDDVGNVSAPLTHTWTVEESDSGGGEEEPAPESPTTPPSETSTGPIPTSPRPAPAPSCPVVAGWPFDPCSRLTFGRRAVRRRGALAVRVRCEGPRRCRGSLRALARRRASTSAGRRQVVARGRYRLQAGERRRVRLRLTRAGRRLLRRTDARRRVRLRLQARPSPGQRWRTVDRVVVRVGARRG